MNEQFDDEANREDIHVPPSDGESDEQISELYNPSAYHEEVMEKIFYVCPFCGDREPEREWLKCSPPPPPLYGDDMLIDYTCANGHNWLAESAWPPDGQLLTTRLGVFTLPNVDGVEVPAPREVDVSSLGLLVCPECALGMMEGTHMLDVIPYAVDPEQTVVICCCDNNHFWVILVNLNNKHRRTRMKCVYLGSAMFGKVYFRKPEFDVDTVLQEAQRVIDEGR